MNRFIKLSTFFCLPILLFIILFEFSVRHIPTSYKQKTEWMETHLSQTEIIVLGSSHGYYGINPAFLLKPSVNLANVSQTLKYDMLLLNQYINRCPKLQYIILPISYFSFFEELEHTNEWWRIISYQLYMRCNEYPHTLKYNFEIAYPDVARKKFLDYYLKKKDLRTCTDKGFGTAYSLNKKSKNWDNGMQRAYNNTYENKSDTLNNKNYLNTILQECASREIKLILITTPTWHTFYKNLNEEQQEMTNRFIKEILNTDRNVIYLNYLTDKRFTEDDFYDADHLSDMGAEKFTRILQDTLYQIYY